MPVGEYVVMDQKRRRSQRRAGPLRRWLVLAMVALVLVVLGWKQAVAFADRRIDQRSFENVYDGCHKVWSARGLYRDRSEQNSVESFRRAFDRGAHGAEVDLHYDVRTDRFIISHDHPVEDEDGHLVYQTKNGKLLTLEELLAAVGSGHFFWLDFKNLDHLDVEETEAAIDRLRALTRAGDLKERLYIEGSNPLRIAMYSDAGFNTILGIHPPSESRPFSSLIVDAYKIAFWRSRAAGIAMAFGPGDDPNYGENAVESLGSIPIFLFHVPDDRELLEDLAHRDKVRVILVAKGVSLDRFSIHGCPPG